MWRWRMECACLGAATRDFTVPVGWAYCWVQDHGTADANRGNKREIGVGKYALVSIYRIIYGLSKPHDCRITLTLIPNTGLVLRLGSHSFVRTHSKSLAPPIGSTFARTKLYPSNQFYVRNLNHYANGPTRVSYTPIAF